MTIFGFDLSNLFTFSNILAIVLGNLVGLLIGALPGLGTMFAIVLLLPATYTMNPLSSVLLLLAAYQGSEYGGSISSIVLGIPGTPASTATLLDGNTLSKLKSPGKALGYSLTSSMLGGLFGGLVLISLTIPLMKFAMHISDPETFLICLIGLLAVGLLSTANKIFSLISIIIGLMAGTVGMDLLTGVSRFTLGFPELEDGINIIAFVVGLFAIPEILSMISDGLNHKRKLDSKGMKTGISFKELRGVLKATGIGAVIGSMVGAFPGLGADAASWFSYTAAKKASKHPEMFGRGNPEGISAPEAANNATVGGSLVPLLSLGIPGTASASIILGAFMIHGIQPGPQIFAKQHDLVYGILFGTLLITIVMYLLGKYVTTLFTRILLIPSSFLIPNLLILTVIGIFSSKGVFMDLWIAFIVSIVMFIFRKLEFSAPSMVIAFVLGPIMETSLRRSLVLSNGSYSIFFTRSFSLVLVLIIAVIIIMSLLKWFKNRKRETVPSPMPLEID